MIQPALLHMAGDRWVPFIRDLPIVNADLTGADFALQIRLYPDAPGAALVDLATVTSASAQGVRLVSATSATVAEHIAAERLSEVPPGYSSSATVTVSLLGIRINETTMEGLPPAVEPGQDTVLSWDLIITPAGGAKDKYAGGLFLVRAGVTQ